MMKGPWKGRGATHTRSQNPMGDTSSRTIFFDMTVVILFEAIGPT